MERKKQSPAMSIKYLISVVLTNQTLRALMSHFRLFFSGWTLFDQLLHFNLRPFAAVLMMGARLSFLSLSSSGWSFFYLFSLDGTFFLVQDRARADGVGQFLSLQRLLSKRGGDKVFWPRNHSSSRSPPRRQNCTQYTHRRHDAETRSVWKERRKETKEGKERQGRNGRDEGKERKKREEGKERKGRYGREGKKGMEGKKGRNGRGRKEGKRKRERKKERK